MIPNNNDVATSTNESAPNKDSIPTTVVQHQQQQQRVDDDKKEVTSTSTTVVTTPVVIIDTTTTNTRIQKVKSMMKQQQNYGERLVLPEWENHDTNYRLQQGWYGNDYIHSPLTSNVYIMDSYHVQYNNKQQHQRNHNITSASTNTSNHPPPPPEVNDTHPQHPPDPHSHRDSSSTGTSTSSCTSSSIGTTVTGFVHYTTRAESHAGYCHGGATCAIMDDIIGWTAFCCNTTNGCIPWSGYTVQINTKLCQPIPIDSYLYIQGTITNIIRRKVYVTAVLYDLKIPNDQSTDDKEIQPPPLDIEENRVIYATGEGIVVMNPGILPPTTIDTTDTTTTTNNNHDGTTTE